jgi:hypothetical protein
LVLTCISSISPVAILPIHDGGTDHVGRALLAFSASGHYSFTFGRGVVPSSQILIIRIRQIVQGALGYWPVLTHNGLDFRSALF